MKINVNVCFRGTITVETPEGLTIAQSKILAEKLAIAKILATDENPDCGECLEKACEEFLEDTSGTTEDDFDAAEIVGVAGSWELAD